jgi:thiamine transport system substrate-binding protein
MKQVYGDKAPKAWTKLKGRILTTTPGWTEAYGLFTKGEAPMVLSYTTSPAYHMIEEKTDRYQAASFAEGHYMQVEVAGIIDASAHRALAEKFMSFMLSPAFQNVIPTTNWMLPAAATSKPLPDAFNTLVQPSKTLLYSPEEVNSHRRAWIDEWLKAIN